MAITTVSQLPELPLTDETAKHVAHSFMLPVDATFAVGGEESQQTYKMGLSAIRDFVLNSSNTYKTTQFTTDTQDIIIGKCQEISTEDGDGERSHCRQGYLDCKETIHLERP